MDKLEDGFIYYLKNGIIRTVTAPCYGRVVLTYHQEEVVKVSVTKDENII